MPQPICPHCRGDAEHETIAEANGRHGRVRVRVSNLSVLRCTYCGKAGLRYAEFLPDAGRVLESLCAVPSAAKAGLFRKRPACCDCRTLLDEAEIVPMNCSGDLEIIDPPFRAEVSVLVLACPGCGTRQLGGGEEPFAQEIVQALVRALEAAEVSLPSRG